jgi:uncharacterized protein YjbI with pentapeptide repeats
VAEGGVNNGVQQAELWSQSHASRKDLRHSGDTTILLHILNHGSDMQREQRLTDRLSNYGTVLAATIRSRPEEDSSWALVTFATSTEVAKVLEDGKMLAAEGLIAEQTDEHLAFSSTGAMRDVASTHRNRVSKRYLADSGRDKGLTLSFADAMLDGLVYDQYEKPDFEKTPWQHWVRGYGQSVALLEQDARPVPDERAVLLSVLVCWAGYNIAIDGEHLDADDKEAARLARESSPHYLLLRGLAQAQLTGTYMRGAELDDAILHGACLQHCDLQEAVLTRASLQEARLEYSNLNDASLDHADIREAHLEHANLATASLKRANLYTTRLEHADLRGACLEHANLKEARLEHADLRGADLRWANLSGANLTSANLSGAQLQHANLDGAQLQLANLREAQLQNARLDRAQLQHADLSSANLEQASFQGSHLQYARMENVNLNNAQHVETAEFSPMPPVARRRRATEKSWALQLRHTIIGMPHDELDEEEYDEENDGEDAETRTNTLGPKDTFEQEPSLGLDNPIAGKGDDSQSAACFEGILIGGFTLNVLTEGRLRNVANTPIELASRLTKINIQLILVDATEMRTTLDTRIVSILEDHATRSKAIFLLRTTPLSIQYTRWCDAQTRDLRDADAERRAFLVIAEDWFLFAAAITAAAHALSARQLKKFVEEAYARVLRGEEKLKQGSELKFVGEHPDQLSLLALCEHKLAQTTAAEVHRTEIALIVQTKYAARGLLPATKALLFSTRKMSTDLKELEYLMLHLERLQSSVDVTNWDDWCAALLCHTSCPAPAAPRQLPRASCPAPTLTPGWRAARTQLGYMDLTRTIASQAPR